MLGKGVEINGVFEFVCKDWIKWGFDCKNVILVL